MVKVFVVSCEYDIGQDEYIFEDSALAEEWANTQADYCDLEGWDALFKDGLISIEEKWLVKRNGQGN